MSITCPYLCDPPQSNNISFPRFGIFFLFEKENACKRKANSGFHPETPRPRQRRTSVHSLRFSVGCSAHSPANAPELERMRARASCFASRSIAPLSWLIKHCGAAFAGSRGAALSLLFFCRRFLFQIKRKCRNAGSIKV